MDALSHNMSMAKATRRAVLATVWIVAVTFFIGPVIWLTLSSLQTQADSLRLPPVVISVPPAWNNYIELLVGETSVVRSYVNTVLYGVALTIVTVASSSLAAYGFAVYRAPGRDSLFVLLVATMLVPFPALMIPQYLLFQRLGWIDTYLPLLIPALGGTPFVIYLLRQFMAAVPKDLLDAARVDGAGPFAIYSQIMIPAVARALVAVSVLTLAAGWNDYLGPLLFLNSRELFPLQVALAGLIARRDAPHWGLLGAASVVAVLPLVILFLVTQKVLMEGMEMVARQG